MHVIENRWNTRCFTPPTQNVLIVTQTRDRVQVSLNPISFSLPLLVFSDNKNIPSWKQTFCYFVFTVQMPKGAIRSHHYTWMMGGASHSRLSWTFSCCLSVHTQGRTAMDTLNSCYQVTRLHPPLNVNNCFIECKVWSVLVSAAHRYINLNPYIKPTRPSSSCQLSHI